VLTGSSGWRLRPGTPLPGESEGSTASDRDGPHRCIPECAPACGDAIYHQGLTGVPASESSRHGDPSCLTPARGRKTAQRTVPLPACPGQGNSRMSPLAARNGEWWTRSNLSSPEGVGPAGGDQCSRAGRGVRRAWPVPIPVRSDDGGPRVAPASLFVWRRRRRAVEPLDFTERHGYLT